MSRNDGSCSSSVLSKMSRNEEGCCPSSLRPSALNKPGSIYDFGYHEEGCCSSSLRPAALNKPSESIYDFGYPRPENEVASPLAYNMVSKAGSFSYSRYGNDTSFKDLEIGWDRGDDLQQNKDSRPYMIRWKSGKKVDQRLLMLLESFYQEIYVKRQDFFKRIFPGMYEEFADVFSKIGAMLWKNNDRVKHRSMRRSLSVGSPRRTEWFNVKTPNVIVGNPDGPGDKTGSGKPT